MGARMPPASSNPTEDRSESSVSHVLQSQASVTHASVTSAKSCGACTECCKVLSIPEIKKPRWAACPHIESARGCGIYATRPPSCRSFMCGWLLDPGMGPDLKPDNCHVIFYQRSDQHIVAVCDPDHPEAWRQPHVTGFLQQLGRAVAPDRKVLVLEKGETWLVTERGILPADRA
jgi:hypothetical protein